MLTLGAIPPRRPALVLMTPQPGADTTSMRCEVPDLADTSTVAFCSGPGAQTRSAPALGRCLACHVTWHSGHSHSTTTWYLTRFTRRYLEQT